MTNRREFLGQAGLGFAGASALTDAAHAVPTNNASDEILVGAIGCGGQGTALLKKFASIKGVRVAYVCDPDDDHAANAAKAVEAITNRAPKIVKDLRRVLDDQSIDAVTVATPDHWHAPATILACDAGKHVYVEKPCSHNIREGKLMVEAARRNKRVVQHGTQSRSLGNVVHGIKMLRDGVIGDVLVAKAWDIQKRGNIGRASAGTPPPRFDYDLWIGPAPMVPFQSNRHHYNWHWWYDFGTGDTGNDGVHELDIARWGLGVEGHPSTITAAGTKLYFDDDQQFPDTQLVVYDYPGDGGIGKHKQLIFEMRIWAPYAGPDGIDNGNEFYGTDGRILLSKRGDLKLFDRKNAPRPIPGPIPTVPSHQDDFIDAIRTGRKPNAEIEVGYYSACLAHLGNIASRVGRTLHFDPSKERFTEDEANPLIGRTYRDGHWAVPKNI